MKFTVLTSDLKNSTNTCSHFISAKSALPILGSILLKTEKNRLMLFSTNLETSVAISIPAKIEEEGEIAVPGKIFNDLVNNIGSLQIEIDSDKEKIKVLSEGFKSNLVGMNSVDFPKVPSNLSKNTIKIPSSELKQCLNKTLFTVSNDDTRPVLTGVLFEFNKDQMSFVSTDGFRLSKKTINVRSDSEEFNIIVPRLILLEIVKNTEGGDVEFSFDLNDNQIVFKYNETIYSSRLIEGSFPDYNKIIPNKFIYSLSVDKLDFEKSIRLASVIARESGNVAKLKIEKEKMLIFAQNQSFGDQESGIEIKRDDQEESDLEISFNFKFLEDIVKNIEADEIIINLNDQNSSAKFVDIKDSNFFHLIMPIRS